MKRIVVIHFILLLYLFILNVDLGIAMEPDVETLSDQKFAAKFQCLADHFQIEGPFEREEWFQALKVIEELENKGYSDKALSVAKGKIFFKTKKYDKALYYFQLALEQKYKCYWISYRLTYPPLKDFADQGIIWHYIYQVYIAMGMTSQANAALNTSVNYLMKSFDLATINNIDDKKNAKITIEKIFQLYDLYRKPLWPFNPWSQNH